MADTYDVVVIGAGAVGENAAWYAIDNGMTAALVERELVGGECSYWACMPSKALLRPGEVLAAARRVPGAAPAVTGGVDTEAALRSRDTFISYLDDTSQVEWVEGMGAALLRGTGRLAGARTVEVTAPDGDVRTLHADRAVVVATGSSTAPPPVDGLDTFPWWDNRDVTNMAVVPRRLLVLGGGVVGAEMAQAVKRLGAREVTVIELDDRLLAAEEPFVHEYLRAALSDDGITVMTGAATERASRDGDDGPVTLELDDRTTLTGDELLVATGRRPNSGDIGLDTVGLTPGEPITVDDHMRADGVDGGWLYAAGDVNGRALFTHQGKYQARIAADAIAGRDVAARADQIAVPRVAFTDPQVAAVGLTRNRAAEAGIDVQTHTIELSVAGTSLAGQDVAGTAHLVVDAAQRTIVGATFVGPTAGEMLHAATIAIVSGISLDDLWHAVPAFPTISEVWLRLLEADRGIS
jgi:dihydrolipoamide dehydrogenase